MKARIARWAREIVPALWTAIRFTFAVLLFAYAAGVIVGAFGAGYNAMCGC